MSDEEQKRRPKTYEELEAELVRVKHKNRVYKHNMQQMQRSLERNRAQLIVAQFDLESVHKRDRTSTHFHELHAERTRRFELERQVASLKAELAHLNAELQHIISEIGWVEIEVEEEEPITQRSVAS